MLRLWGFPAVSKLVLVILLSSLLMLQGAEVENTSKGPVCADSLCQSDPLGFEAIAQLHRLIDDDSNGNLDREESDEFFRDELKHEDGAAFQATFHGADDLISVNDLWKLWTHSKVYNWTVEEVIAWLQDDVELPKYVESFRVNAVDGHILPRLAVNSQYVTSILTIKSAVHRQKLSIKATDLVLFGRNKKGHNWLKDLLLVSLLAVATVIAWWARRQHHESQKHVRKVMLELEGLQQSEDSFKKLQHKFEETKREHLRTAQEKRHLEERLEGEICEAKNEADRLRTTRETTEEELSRLKLAELELIEVHKALAEAERRCEQLSAELPPVRELQQWLQLTYEIETEHYEAKREAAEVHLRVAREMCDKIRKRRSGLLGSLRVAHSTSLYDTDQSIMQARGALEEVRLHLQERNQRWQEIELICGFDIIQNPGLHVLETNLRGIGGTYLAGCGLTRAPSVSTFSNVSTLPLEEMDEDMTPGHMAAAGAWVNGPGTPVLQAQAGPIQQYPDRRMLPNLMKAGMQLTMLGLGLTNPNLGAIHPSMVTDVREKRRTLVDALGRGSSHNLTGSLGHHSKTLPHILTRSDTSHSIVSDQTNTQTSTSGVENGRPKFNLGENGYSSDASTKDHDVPPQYVKSKSVEVTKSVARPRSLITSHSDPHIQGSIKTPSKRNSTKIETPTVKEENSAMVCNSSSDSYDDGKENSTKVNKRSGLKKLFKSKPKKKDS